MKKKNDLSKVIYGNKIINETEEKLNLLGITKKITASSFLNIRLITTIIVFILVIYLFDFGYVLAPIISYIYYTGLYYLLIEKPVRDRISILEEEAMHFFEVLTLSLETGRNLEDAVLTTCNNVNGNLSNEFKKALAEVKFGKSLSESLSDMKKSIPSETINNIIISITQSNLFGNSIIETLNNQIDYLRDKKIMEVKAVISKVPTKISIISVLFFIPLILMIILAPVLVGYLG